jgi:hypothetical protein
LFTSQLAAGHLLNAIGMPIAADFALVPYALIVGAVFPIVGAVASTVTQLAELAGLRPNPTTASTAATTTTASAEVGSGSTAVSSLTAPVSSAASSVTAPVKAAASSVTTPVHTAISSVTTPVTTALTGGSKPVTAAVNGNGAVTASPGQNLAPSMANTTQTAKLSGNVSNNQTVKTPKHGHK